MDGIQQVSGSQWLLLSMRVPDKHKVIGLDTLMCCCIQS